MSEVRKTLTDLINSEFTEAEQAAYQRLLAAEKLVDEELFRRQIALREAQAIIDPRIQPYPCVRKLRLSIYSRVDGLPDPDGRVFWGAPAALVPPSLTLRVQGFFPDPAPRAAVFSEVVDKVIIHFPPIIAQDSVGDQAVPALETFIYTSPPAGSPVEDGFEIKRPLSEAAVAALNDACSTPVVLEVFLRSGVELLELSPALARVVGAEVATVPVVYRELCQYIKTKGLMRAAAGTYGTYSGAFGSEFVADAVLAEVLGLEVNKAYHLSALVTRLRELFVWEGRVVKLEVQVSAPSGVHYDILVDSSMADALTVGRASVTAEPPDFVAVSRQIAEVERELATKVDELKKSVERAKLLNKLSGDVEGVVKELLQTSPALNMSGSFGAVGAEVYRQPWAVVAANQIAAASARK